jgi:hypothetical protein
MKIVQVVPRANPSAKLKSLLKKTELNLRGKGTTLYREKEGRWKHTRYAGWISWEEGSAGILVAVVQTKKPETEWQLLQAFIGYLDRHLAENIDSITVYYR